MVVDDLKVIEEMDCYGIIVYFILDFEIFIEIIVYDFDKLVIWVCELVFLNWGLYILIEDCCEG